MTDVTISPEGSPKAPRVSFWTLGCRLNQYDTAALRARILDSGHGEVPAGSADADVVFVNTCTVTARADQEARQLIRKIHRSQPGARIVVTGCYAQRAPEELRPLPGVSAVLGSAERDEPETLMRAIASRAPFVHVGAGRAIREFKTSAPVLVGRSRALLKIQDGCDSFCSFCIVPYVRGRGRSLPHEEVLTRARRLLHAGFTEIVLTGADLGSYGRDQGETGALTRLVEALLDLGDRHRIRLSSIEPNKVDRALAGLIGSEPRLCRHLHVPLQSGSSRVLRAMRRGYSPDEYASLVMGVSARGPVGIGADVIVGFPGESETEFQETYDLIESLPITFLHVFRYSQRPGTAAARLGAGGHDGSVRERSERLRAMGEAKSEAFRRSLVGTSLPVVMESGRGSRGPIAMSDVYVPVELDRDPERRRGIQTVRIEGMSGTRLAGSLAATG